MVHLDGTRYTIPHGLRWIPLNHQKQEKNRRTQNVELIIIVIIMGIFKCYFSGEQIALSLIKNNNNDVNIELGKNNRLKALCMVQAKT